MSVKDIDKIIKAYIDDVRECLGSDFHRACVYGSYARGEYGEDSDIDIAIFTNRKPGDFYLLINLIAEITFEYNVKYRFDRAVETLSMAHGLLENGNYRDANNRSYYAAYYAMKAVYLEKCGYQF